MLKTFIITSPPYPELQTTLYIINKQHFKKDDTNFKNKKTQAKQPDPKSHCRLLNLNPKSPPLICGSLMTKKGSPTRACDGNSEILQWI